MLVFSFIFQTDYPVRERAFLLLDATQTAVGGAKGKFPEYYTAYYDLVVINLLLYLQSLHNA